MFSHFVLHPLCTTRTDASGMAQRHVMSCHVMQCMPSHRLLRTRGEVRVRVAGQLIFNNADRLACASQAAWLNPVMGALEQCRHTYCACRGKRDPANPMSVLHVSIDGLDRRSLTVSSGWVGML